MKTNKFFKIAIMTFTTLFFLNAWAYAPETSPRPRERPWADGDPPDGGGSTGPISQPTLTFTGDTHSPAFDALFQHIMANGPEVYPGFFGGSLNVRVVELEVRTVDGQRVLYDPHKEKVTAIHVNPLDDPWGPIVTSTEIYLPSAEIDYRAQNGDIVDYTAIVAHESEHIHQIVTNEFDMGTDQGLLQPDIRRLSETAAQEHENSFTRLKLEYNLNDGLDDNDPSNDKNGPNGKYIDANGNEIAQTKENGLDFAYFENRLRFTFFDERSVKTALITNVAF